MSLLLLFLDFTLEIEEKLLYTSECGGHTVNTYTYEMIIIIILFRNVVYRMYSIGEISATYRKKKGLLQQDLAD